MNWKEYKKDFDSINPDPNFLNNVLQNAEKRPSGGKSGMQWRFVAMVTVLCLLLGGGFMTSYLNKPVFTMVAFAAGNIEESIVIEENLQVKLPFGKISRGERDSYIDEKGVKKYSYDVGFDFGGISVKGKNISSVKYTTKLGELQYFDSFAASEVLQSSPDNKPAEVPRLVKLDGIDSCMKRGTEITTTFHKELGTQSFDINWIPWYAIEKVSEDKPVDFSNLPSDRITVTLHFTNGVIITKYLRLSFDKTGDLVAEVISV